MQHMQYILRVDAGIGGIDPTAGNSVGGSQGLAISLPMAIAALILVHAGLQVFSPSRSGDVSMSHYSIICGPC